MAVDPLRDSSSNVYNSQWKSFASWATTRANATKDLSYIMLAEYLIHLFNENQQVNTIKVHRSAIASVLKILNPPTSLQEDNIHNLVHAMSIKCPISQEILPKWHVNMVFKDLIKPPFTVDGSDKNISLEILSYKTPFLLTLATGARGSELVAQSRADHNITFSRLPSGTKHFSIQLVPKFIPKNARPDTIPKPLDFPGIAHLFSRDPERLLCPVRTLGLYIVCSKELADEGPQLKLFMHFTPQTQKFTTHFGNWVAAIIRLTYENSSESDLPNIKSHEVWVVAASVAYYRNTPISELCGLISWKFSNKLPVAAAGITLLWQVVLHRLYTKLTTSTNKV